MSDITIRRGRAVRALLLIVVGLLCACTGPAEPPAIGEVAAPAPPTRQPPASPSEATPLDQAVQVQPTPAPTLLLVTAETGASLDFVRQLAAEFGAQSTWQVEVVAKAPDELRVDLQTALLAEALPDMIWAPADQARALAAAELLQPVPDLVAADTFTPGAVADSQLQGMQWGVPLSAGDQLVLFVNRGLVASPPGTTDELLSMPRPGGVETLLAYDASDPLWLSAWLEGFGGSLRGADGRPAMNTPQMLQTLFFLKELRSREIVPPELDPTSAEALFREGKAAMLATHAWALASFAGDRAPPFELGVVPLPMAAATRRAPAANLPSAQLLVGKGVDGERREAVKEFAAFVTGPSAQERMVSAVRRLPALSSVLQGPAVQGDPVLQTLAATHQEIAPLRPGDPLLDVVRPRLRAVLAGEQPPEEAATEMQEAAAGTSGG